MTAAMRRRGPDDEGIVCFGANDGGTGVLQFGGTDTPEGVLTSPLPYTPTAREGAWPSGAVLALGHRRLSILDLSAAGHQPMCTADGRFWIVYNGEVYNFADIRGELEQKGVEFASHTDTEVVLQAYRRWGKDCLARFNGMWAFAIWDAREESLFCARDRVGIKPLFFFRSQDAFVFASDIKGLIASGIYAPSPDLEGLFHAMTFKCAPRPMTCFAGVESLEPASWMTVERDGRTRKGRYWQIPLDTVDTAVPECEWLEEFERLLALAVKRRLVADVPVGVFMSGGVDSTTVSAFAADTHPGIKAFTLGYENAASHDEVPQARATAARLPLQHIVRTVRPEETLKHLREMTLCYEEPFVTLCPNYMIAQLVSENDVKVVLNGLGGDELFCGYGREAWLRRLRLARPASGIASRFPFSPWKRSRLGALRSLKDVIDYYVFIFSLFTEREKHALLAGGQPEWSSYGTFRDLYALDSIAFRDDIQALCYLDVINYISNHHVYRIDQFTMHFSIEGRFPFLDHELIEWAFRMDSSLKVHGGVGKYILRQLAHGRIDSSCLDMKKKGFCLPMDQWMRSTLQDLVSRKAEAFKRREWVSGAMVDLILSEFRLGRMPARMAWWLVSAELWMETLIEGSDIL